MAKKIKSEKISKKNRSKFEKKRENKISEKNGGGGSAGGGR